MLNGCFFSLPSCSWWLSAFCLPVWNSDVLPTSGSRFKIPCSSQPLGSVTVPSGLTATRVTDLQSSFTTALSPFSKETGLSVPGLLIYGPVFIRIPCSEIMIISTAFYLRICWMRYYYSRIFRVTSSSTSIWEDEL
jgi:hypothetical protein